MAFESNIMSTGWEKQFMREGGNMVQCLTDQSHDHVPVNPFVMGNSAICHGKTLMDYYTRPDLGVQWMVAATTAVYDCAPNNQWLYAIYWTEDYGGTIKMPVGRMSAPGILTHGAPTIEQAENLRVLSHEELNKGPTMKMHWQAMDINDKIFGDGFNPYQFIYELFVVASYWVGPENLLMWVHNEPQLVRNLMKKAVEHSDIVCDLVRDKYGKPPFVICSSLLANSSTMTPEQCMEFNIKYLKEANDKILKKGCSGFFYHLCGDHGQDYQLHDDCPFPPGSIFHVAYDGLKPADLTQVAKQYENRVALLGNVDTALIGRGKPKQIYDEAYRTTMAYKHFKKGFVQGLACECPPFAPSGNIAAFVKGSKDAGKMKE